MKTALMPGDRVGSYEVIDRLGAGGMGEVYRARDTRLGRDVALKVLRSGDDPGLLRRLDREARAASALNHPNIVHIYDVGEAPRADGAHYVAMELVEGETLRRRLRPGPLPMGELLDLAAQLADGLAKAHRAGIVHRDLKPENVMVTPDGVLKIVDFGLAKVLAAPFGNVVDGETVSRHGTEAGMLMGTIEYMSPEQASGRVMDHRTDQFSLGLILHEMAVGRSPFRRDSPAQVLAAVIERDPEPLGRLRGDVPQALEALVLRCLQKDPERRFARTDELASALAALAGRSRSGSIGAPSQVAATAPSAAPVQAVPPLPPTATQAIYHVQARRGVRRYDEAQLAQLIRRGKLTGVELVRRDGEEQWQPLFDSRIYRLEVPTLDDPRDAARMRVVNALGGHFMGFFITAVVMYGTQGHFPFWLGIWGAVLAMQAIGALPAALALFRKYRAAIDAPAGRPGLRPAEAPPSAAAVEAARVRTLIEKWGGSDAPRLLSEVDGIVRLSSELAARQADLEEQTSAREQAAVAAAIVEARGRLERADLAQDRRLFEHQLQILDGRADAIAKAVRVLERLRVRREVAEHQLKQLRLDLSRDAAGGLDVPELSSRLQFIRDEVDAREEVREIAAERR